MGWTRKELLLPKRLTDEERAKIAARLLQEPNVSKVAREFGRAKSTVAKIAREAGADIERTQTEKATEARQADNAKRLEDLKARLLEEAAVALDELHKPARIHNWNKGEHFDHEIEEPTATDKRNIMWRAGGAITNYLNIDEHQGGGEESYAAVDEWLAAMAGGES